jgi:predicted amidohydrolase YtcJ
VGNGALAALLDAIDADPALAAAVPLRAEHAIALDRPMADRIARTGPPVVVQPGFLAAFGHELAIVPVPAPMKLMPFRTMLDAGVALAFSSDYPAAELSPWAAIAGAVTRRDRTGSAIHPDEVMTVAAALDASTRSAARVLGAGGPDAGTLEPGAAADMAWFDRDPYVTRAADLGGIGALATWSGGRLVHERPG